MKDQDKLFQAGFNAGYYLQKFAPKLFEKLVSSNQSKSLFFDGMINGGKEEKMELRIKDLGKTKQLDDVDRSPEL